MSKALFFLLFLLVSCNNKSETRNENKNSDSNKNIQLPITTNKHLKEWNWIGTINSKIPVFIHYSFEDSLFIGEIIYLNTKNKKPIRLLCDINDDNGDSLYRFLEFDPTGNITGVITGLPNKNKFEGKWYSTVNNKAFPVSLIHKDTSIKFNYLKPTKDEIVGKYHYQYGKEGYSGDIEISKVDNDRISFYILSLTNVKRGPNIAEVDKDTIQMIGNTFTYTVSEEDSCGFKATFYKDFLSIRYTHGYCGGGEFGLNATIDGIYLKTK